MLQKVRWNDRDGTVDNVLAVLDSSGYSDKKICDMSGLSRSTLQSWRSGKTRNPLNISLRVALRVVGKEFQIVDVLGGKR